MSSSDPRERTGGSVSGLSHTLTERGEAPYREKSNGEGPDDVPLPSEHAYPRTEAYSGYKSPSQAHLPMAWDNSRFPRNEETDYDPKQTTEKGTHVEKNRASTVNEGSGSRPGVSDYVAHHAQHRQTEPDSQWGHTPHTVPSPNTALLTAGGRVHSHNPIDRNNPGSTDAHDTGKTRKRHKRLLKVPPLPQLSQQLSDTHPLLCLLYPCIRLTMGLAHL
jgi:hypothetical protein